MNIQIQCKAVQNTCLGILVFVLSGMVAFPVLSQDHAQVFGDWTYEIITDEMSGTKHHVAITSAIRGQLGSGPSATMIVKCDARKKRPYASYRTGKFMGINFDETQVTYRIDQEAPVDERWKMSDRSVLDIGGKMTDVLPSKMMAGKQLIMRAFTYDNHVVQHQFSLNGASAAIGLVLDNCGGRLPDVNNVPQPTYTYQQLPPSKPQPRRPITGSTKGMSLEDILGQ